MTNSLRRVEYSEESVASTLSDLADASSLEESSASLLRSYCLTNSSTINPMPVDTIKDHIAIDIDTEVNPLTIKYITVPQSCDITSSDPWTVA